jgi:biotin carboxyl carrier protein
VLPGLVAAPKKERAQHDALRLAQDRRAPHRAHATPRAAACLPDTGGRRWRAGGIVGRISAVNLLVVAETVGTVVELSVAVGDRVDPGDTLIVLESMKMEIPVLAERSGTVAALPIRTGDVVSEGDTIAVLAE